MSSRASRRSGAGGNAQTLNVATIALLDRNRLIKELSERGLPTSGSKNVLSDRLYDFVVNGVVGKGENQEAQSSSKQKNEKESQPQETEEKPTIAPVSTPKTRPSTKRRLSKEAEVAAKVIKNELPDAEAHAEEEPKQNEAEETVEVKVEETPTAKTRRKSTSSASATRSTRARKVKQEEPETEPETDDQGVKEVADVVVEKPIEPDVVKKKVTKTERKRRQSSPAPAPIKIKEEPVSVPVAVSLEKPQIETVKTPEKIPIQNVKTEVVDIIEDTLPDLQRLTRRSRTLKRERYSPETPSKKKQSVSHVEMEEHHDEEEEEEEEQPDLTQDQHNDPDFDGGDVEMETIPVLTREDPVGDDKSGDSNSSLGRSPDVKKRKKSVMPKEEIFESYESDQQPSSEHSIGGDSTGKEKTAKVKRVKTDSSIPDESSRGSSSLQLKKQRPSISSYEISSKRPVSNWRQEWEKTLAQSKKQPKAEKVGSGIKLETLPSSAASSSATPVRISDLTIKTTESPTSSTASPSASTPNAATSSSVRRGSATSSSETAVAGKKISIIVKKESTITTPKASSGHADLLGEIMKGQEVLKASKKSVSSTTTSTSAQNRNQPINEPAKPSVSLPNVNGFGMDRQRAPSPPPPPPPKPTTASTMHLVVPPPPPPPSSNPPHHVATAAAGHVLHRRSRFDQPSAEYMQQYYQQYMKQAPHMMGLPVSAFPPMPPGWRPGMPLPPVPPPMHLVMPLPVPVPVHVPVHVPASMMPSFAVKSPSVTSTPLGRRDLSPPPPPPPKKSSSELVAGPELKKEKKESQSLPPPPPPPKLAKPPVSTISKVPPPPPPARLPTLPFDPTTTASVKPAGGVMKNWIPRAALSTVSSEPPQSSTFQSQVQGPKALLEESWTRALLEQATEQEKQDDETERSSSNDSLKNGQRPKDNSNPTRLEGGKEDNVDKEIRLEGVDEKESEDDDFADFAIREVVVDVEEGRIERRNEVMEDRKEEKIRQKVDVVETEKQPEPNPENQMRAEEEEPKSAETSTVPATEASPEYDPFENMVLSSPFCDYVPTMMMEDDDQGTSSVPYMEVAGEEVIGDDEENYEEILVDDEEGERVTEEIEIGDDDEAEDDHDVQIIGEILDVDHMGMMPDRRLRGMPRGKRMKKVVDNDVVEFVDLANDEEREEQAMKKLRQGDARDLLKLALPVLQSLNFENEKGKGDKKGGEAYAQMEEEPTGDGEEIKKTNENGEEEEVYYHGDPVPEVDENELFEIAAGIKPAKKKEKKPLVTIIDEEALPSSENIELDYYNSSMHIKSAEKNIWQIEPYSNDGLALMWGGVRSNFGVKMPFRMTEKEKSCKIGFQIKIDTFQSVQHLPTEFSDKGDVRVGFSLASAPLVLGEYTGSWCISASGKKATANIFADFGASFDAGDVITCIMDTESGTLSYLKNNETIGVAYDMIKLTSGSEQSEDLLFPTVCVKNANVNVNFGDSPNNEELEWNVPEERDWIFLTEMDRSHLVRSRVAPEGKSACTVLMTVGLPGVGKTTWVRRYLADHPHENWTVISADQVMDAMRVNGVPRNRLPTLKRHDFLRGMIGKSMARLVQLAPRRRRNYLLDMTNCIMDKRNRKLMQFEDFNRKCVVFVPDEEVHIKRLIQQEHEENEKLDTDALMQHKAAMSIPTAETDPCEEVLFVDPAPPYEHLAFERVQRMNQDCRAWLLDHGNRRRGGHHFPPFNSQNFQRSGGYQSQHQQSLYNNASVLLPHSSSNQVIQHPMKISHTTFPSTQNASSISSVPANIQLTIRAESGSEPPSNQATPSIAASSSTHKGNDEDTIAEERFLLSIHDAAQRQQKAHSSTSVAPRAAAAVASTDSVLSPHRTMTGKTPIASPAVKSIEDLGTIRITDRASTGSRQSADTPSRSGTITLVDNRSIPVLGVAIPKIGASDGVVSAVSSPSTPLSNVSERRPSVGMTIDANISSPITRHPPPQMVSPLTRAPPQQAMYSHPPPIAQPQQHQPSAPYMQQISAPPQFAQQPRHQPQQYFGAPPPQTFQPNAPPPTFPTHGFSAPPPQSNFLPSQPPPNMIGRNPNLPVQGAQPSPQFMPQQAPMQQPQWGYMNQGNQQQQQRF